MWSSLFQLPNTLTYTFAILSGGISLCTQTWHLRLVGWWVESAVCQIYTFTEKCYCGVDLFLKFPHLPHSVSKLYMPIQYCMYSVYGSLWYHECRKWVSADVRFSAIYSYFCLILLDALMSFPYLICFSPQEAGFGNSMLPLWFALLGGSFVFLDVYFHFVPCIPLFWVLWFIYDWQGFII